MSGDTIPRTAQHIGRTAYINREIEQTLRPVSLIEIARLHLRVERKTEEVLNLFPNLPLTKEVTGLIRRWAALDVLLKSDGNGREKVVSQDEYDAEVGKALDFLREKQQLMATIIAETRKVIDQGLPYLQLQKKEEFIRDMFVAGSPVSRGPLHLVAQRWVALDILLERGMPQGRYDDMVDCLKYEIEKEKASFNRQRGITPSSSNVSYARKSSAPLAGQQRTT